MGIKATIRVVEGEPHLRAYVDVELGSDIGRFKVKGLCVMESGDRIWVNMPQKQGNAGKYYEQFHPLDKESREALQTSVIAEYQHQINKTQTSETDNTAKKQTKETSEQEQEQGKPIADEPKATRGRKKKEPEPEPHEEQGMAMGM